MADIEQPPKAQADYTNDSMQLLMQVVAHLAKHPLDPQPLPGIVDALAPASRDQVFRALWNLEKAGWAKKVGTAYTLDAPITLISERLRRATVEMLNHYLGGR